LFVDDILTLDEVAKYLRVSERTVYTWAQRGELPAGKIGTEWRFKKDEIEQWVNQRLAKDRVDAPVNTVRVESIISPTRIVFLDEDSKDAALRTLADNLATAPQVKNRQELIDEILKRDELMSTAIGQGIAIPHVRLPSVTDLVVSVGISRQPIDFQSLDNKPVRLLLMIAAAYNQHAYYLQTLSFFSARLKNPALRTALMESQTADDAYQLLLR
jgi:PTS system nitrogen regulatory IIA component